MLVRKEWFCDDAASVTPKESRTATTSHLNWSLSMLRGLGAPPGSPVGSSQSCAMQGLVATSASGIGGPVPVVGIIQQTLRTFVEIVKKRSNDKFDVGFRMGPFGHGDEGKKNAIDTIKAFAADKNTGGGAHGARLDGNRKPSETRGAQQGLSCAGRSGTYVPSGTGARECTSAKCGCPWKVWLEEAVEGWVVNQMPVACAGANGTHGGTHPLATSLAEANAQSSLRGVPQPGPLHDLATILQAAGQSAKQINHTLKSYADGLGVPVTWTYVTVSPRRLCAPSAPSLRASALSLRAVRAVSPRRLSAPSAPSLRAVSLRRLRLRAPFAPSAPSLGAVCVRRPRRLRRALRAVSGAPFAPSPRALQTASARPPRRLRRAFRAVSARPLRRLRRAFRAVSARPQRALRAPSAPSPRAHRTVFAPSAPSVPSRPRTLRASAAPRRDVGQFKKTH